MSSKNQYKNLIKEIKIIVNKYDPIGLIESGAPDDEYDSEIAQIVILCTKDLTVEDMASEIHQIFIKMFDEKIAGKRGLYVSLATDIKNQIQF